MLRPRAKRGAAPCRLLSSYKDQCVAVWRLDRDRPAVEPIETDRVWEVWSPCAVEQPKQAAPGATPPSVGPKGTVEDHDKATVHGEDAGDFGGDRRVQDVRGGKGGDDGVRGTVGDRDGIGPAPHDQAPWSAAPPRRLPEHRRRRLDREPTAPRTCAHGGQSPGAGAELDDQPLGEQVREHGLLPAGPLTEEEPIGEPVVESGAPTVQEGKDRLLQPSPPSVVRCSLVGIVVGG